MKKVLGIVLTLTIAFAMAACSAKRTVYALYQPVTGISAKRVKENRSNLLCNERRRRPLPLLKLQMVLLPEFMRRL